MRAGMVLRSLLGHIAAAKTQDDAVKTDDKIRDYLVGGGPLDQNCTVCGGQPSGPVMSSLLTMSSMIVRPLLAP